MSRNSQQILRQLHHLLKQPIQRNFATNKSESFFVTKKIIIPNQGAIKNLSEGSAKYSAKVLIDNFEAIEKSLPQPQEHKIEVRSAHHLPQILQESGVSQKGVLSFDISEEEIMKITNDLQNLFRDPFKVAKCLSPLNSRLKEELSTRKMAPKINVPHLISAQNFLLPAIENNELDSVKLADNSAAKLLCALILQFEQECGVNKNGVLSFCGGVNRIKANEFMSEGYNFQEDLRAYNLILHGDIVHRLGSLVVFEAIKNGFFETQLSPKQLIELFVNVALKIKTSSGAQGEILMWDLLFDRADENQNDDDLSINFSAISPFNFYNTLILSFGEELGLESLQQSMLNSHFLAWASHIKRLRDQDHSQKLPTEDGEVHQCLAAFISHVGSYLDIDWKPPFALSSAEVEREYKDADCVKKALHVALIPSEVVYLALETPNKNPEIDEVEAVCERGSLERG